MMMNRKGNTLLLTVAILATLVLSACGTVILESERKVVRGSGDVIEEPRTISGVSGVTLATIGNLHIEVGSSESLTVTAQENLLEYIETDVTGGKLIIGTSGNVEVKSFKPIDYYLTVKSLDSIRLASSGDIDVLSDLEGEKFSVDIASSGNVTMSVLNADMLDVNINSSGDLNIMSGEAKTQTINIGSSGKYTAKDLASDEADVRVNSSGSVTIWVKERLTATINSSGNVRYRGSATVDGTVNSSGKVIHLGD